MAHGENLRLALEISVPVACAALGVFAGSSRRIASYLVAKTHSQRLGNVVDAAGDIAGAISDALAKLPANVNEAELKSTMVTLAATNLEPAAIGAIGSVNPAVVSLIAGELAKLPPKVTAPVLALVTPPPTPPATA